MPDNAVSQVMPPAPFGFPHGRGAPAEVPVALPVALEPGISRIRFLPSPPPGARVLAQFSAPQRRFAVAEPVSPEMLPEAGAWPEPVDELYLWFLPGGAATLFEEQRRAEAWVARPRAGAGPTFELLLRSDRVLWRPGRGVILGAPDRAEELIAGMVDFAFYEGELRRLEREVAADWPGYEEDAGALTDRLKRRDLQQSSRVNEMTRSLAIRRMRFARLEPRLDNVAASLPPAARRVVTELCQQAETEDRLAAIDDSLEVLEDLYDETFTRLSDFRYFRREMLVEGLIVALLFTETVLLIWQTIVLKTGGNLGGPGGIGS
jgi:hypothetical protein